MINKNKKLLVQAPNSPTLNLGKYFIFCEF